METPLRYYKGRGRYSVVFVVDFKCVSENVSRLVDFYAVLIFGTYYLVTSHVSVYIYILYIWFRSWTPPHPRTLFYYFTVQPHLQCGGGSKVPFTTFRIFSLFRFSSKSSWYHLYICDPSW